MNRDVRLSRQAERRTLPNAAISAIAFFAGLMIGWLTLPHHEAFRAAASDQIAAPSAVDDLWQGELSFVGYLNLVGDARGSD